ncbi:unnamed protein product [Rotaria sp. Silwood2]|nr:unnamed protein product [Rotaria sp. Silwood2]
MGYNEATSLWATIALGVGLGVGLSRRNGASSSSSSSNSSTDSILSASTAACTYGAATCGCAATKPSFLTPRITQGYMEQLILGHGFSGQSRVVYNLTTHPSYSASDFTNDIAILTLQSVFDQTSIVGKCCLTFVTSLPSIGEHAVIVGWGVTSSTSTTVSDQLLQGVIQVQSSSSSCSPTPSRLQLCTG